MRESVKRQLEISETREKINGLLELETRTEEQDSELKTMQAKHKELEGLYRKALNAEEESEQRAAGDGEGAELRQLESKALVADIVAASYRGAQTEGATAELQQHLGLGHNEIPLRLLRVEERAVTPAPSDVSLSQAPILLPPFATTRAAWMGVAMPTVGVGERSYPVMTSRPTVEAPAKGVEVDESTGAFTVDTVLPSRLQASYYFGIEDAASFAGMEAALRSSLNSGLGTMLDYQVFRGANGFFAGANLANNAAAAQATWKTARQQLAYERVDGVWADGVAGIRTLVGAQTYAFLSTLYRTENADGNSLPDELGRITAGIAVSAHVPAKASKKQKCLIRIGEMPNEAVAPIWDGVRIIFDQVTKAKAGQVVLTAVMLYGFLIVRSNTYRKQELQLDA